MASGINQLDLRVSPSVRDVENEDGAVLLDVDRGLCFSLNAVGVKIWSMLKQQIPLEQIRKALTAEFHLPEEQVEHDLQEFMAGLTSEKLVGPASPNDRVNSVKVRSRGQRTLFERVRGRLRGQR